MAWASRLAAVSMMLCLACSPVSAGEFYTLKGHGGPVMDIRLSPAGTEIATAGFDNAVGLWRRRQPRWLDGHDAAVNVVAFIDARRLASAGDDFAVILWPPAGGIPRRLTGHVGKIVDLAVAPDQSWLASASWDGRVGLWPLAGGVPTFLEGHRAGVSAVAFDGGGGQLYSAGLDGTVRHWDMAGLTQKRVLLRHGFGINDLVLGGRARDGAAAWLAYGTVDGVVQVVDLESDRPIARFALDRHPILALTLDRDGRRLAIGDGQGFITLVDAYDWRVERDFQATLNGPIWALSFTHDGETLLAGGIENIVYAWPLDRLAEAVPVANPPPAFLRDPHVMTNGERQFMRKCALCHSLLIDGGRRAGPSLFNILGRRAGSLPGYRYSETLAGADFVWDEKTIDQLFALGPDHFIPGTKMPMQRIVGAEDRRDLVEFLKLSTH